MGIIKDGKIVALCDPTKLGHPELLQAIGLSPGPNIEGFVVEKFGGKLGMDGSQFNKTLSAEAKAAIQALFE